MPSGTARSSTEHGEGSGQEGSINGWHVASPRDGGTAGSKPRGSPTQAVAMGGFRGQQWQRLLQKLPL